MLSSAPLSTPAQPRAVVSPPGWPLIGHVPIVFDLLKASERVRALGDIVKLRVPPYDLYVLNQPRDIEQLLVQDHERYRKDWSTRMLSRILGQGLLVNEGAPWRKQRRIVQPELTPRRIDGYVTCMLESTERALSRFPDAGVLNLHTELMRLTLDIAGQTLFGAKMEPLAAEISDILEQFLQHFLGFFGTGIRFPDWVPTAGNRRAQNNLRRLHTIVGEVIDERRRAAVPASDVLSRLIAARDEQGHPIPDDLLRDEVVTLLLAGHETTALLLTYCVMLLAQHPEIERRVLDELHAQLPDGQPDPAALERLPYLDAVLCESMRLYPPAYAIGREALEDTQIGGCAIPRGAQIWVFQWSVQRDPRFYREPELFRPERWLSAETATLPRFAYLPFGGGPRICPGAHFSLVEAKIVLSRLLPRFACELVSKARPKLEPSVTIRPRGGLAVRVRRRAPRH